MPSSLHSSFKILCVAKTILFVTSLCIFSTECGIHNGILKYQPSNTHIRNYSAFQSTVLRLSDNLGQNSSSISRTKTVEKKAGKDYGIFSTVLNYFLTSNSRHWKEELIKFIDEAKSSGRARAMPTATQTPSWMDSAMVPMSFITFAMFLMDIMQRLFPLPGSTYGWRNPNPYFNNYQAETTTETSLFKITSNFGRSGENQKLASSNYSALKRKPVINKNQHQRTKAVPATYGKISNATTGPYNPNQRMENANMNTYYYNRRWDIK